MTDKQQTAQEITAEIWSQQHQEAIQKADGAFREWQKTGDESAREFQYRCEEEAANIGLKLADLMRKIGR